MWTGSAHEIVLRCTRQLPSAASNAAAAPQIVIASKLAIINTNMPFG